MYEAKANRGLTQTLDLFPIGNCTASALIDRTGRFVWACVPRVDGDPFFSALLGGRDPGTYIAAMGTIARTGAIVYTDPTVLAIPPEFVDLFYRHPDKPGDFEYVKIAA